MIPLDILQSIFRVSWYRSLASTPGPLDLPTNSVLSHKDVHHSDSDMRRLEDLSQEVVRLFAAPCEVKEMLQMSTQMRECYYDKLRSSPACMLPSFCHTLPSGRETGTFVALDVGGSTFRVALVQLNKRHGNEEPIKIKRMSSAKIDESVRRMPARDFFDWMAQRIQKMLSEDPDTSHDETQSVPVGLAWSFPIEQTSNRSGKVQGMGKGFTCHDSLGEDLGELIESACRKAGFRVRVEAIINDSSAVLLSQAYTYPSTSMGLILGTGTNAAAFLPVSCMGKEKFGARDQSWHDRADRVITNTELSMFGKDILPRTRWDDALNRDHQRPDFQPLEYMTTGRYLGEILRLIVVEAVEQCRLWSGKLPESLSEQYSLDTALLAMIEDDQSRNLSESASKVQATFNLSHTPSHYEMAFLRAVTEAISHRAAAYLAVAIHALWSLQKDTDVNLTTPFGTPKTSIACNGSVILKYPGFRVRCEDYIEKMVSLGSGGGIFQVEKIVLQPADEAAIVGAAVAVAMADGI